MNVPFVTGNDELDAKFVKEADSCGLCEPEGPSFGGRNARFDLQRNADRGRGEARRIHEEV